MGHTFRSESASESGGSAVSDGAGVIGDSTGITITPCLTTADTFPVAQRFITGAISIAAERTVAESAVAELSIVPVREPGLSAETTGPPADTPRPAAKAGSARVPSAATSVAERLGAFPRAEAPASAAAEDFTGAEAVVTLAAEGDGNRGCRYVSAGS
jgi:hypothetical protein